MQTYDTMASYLKLAKMTISKFGPKFYNGLSAEMLANPDAISDVAAAIMTADWKFDPNRSGKSGQKKTLYSYRNQCALWAIKTYITNKYKKKKDKMSLDFNLSEDSDSMNSTMVDVKNPNPLSILLDQEKTEIIQSSIETLLSCLSEKQKQQIIMYYLEDKTLEEIGKKFNVTREAIRQNIKRGLLLIRGCDEVPA